MKAWLTSNVLLATGTFARVLTPHAHFQTVNKCHPNSPLWLSAWGSPTLRARWWGGRQLPRSHLPPGRWKGRAGREKDCRGDENRPKTMVARSGSLLKGLESPADPQIVSQELFSIPSDYFIGQTLKYHIKILCPGEAKLPQKTSHTLREMFLEMNFLLGNKKPGFSFLWLCPPYELDPWIQPRSELVLSHLLSFKKACCLPSPQERLSTLHCRGPRKVSRAPERHLLASRVEAPTPFRRALTQLLCCCCCC